MDPAPLVIGVERKPTALVGRDALMQRAWTRLTGEGASPAKDAVLLSGLPGIGKHSVAHAIARRALGTEDGRQFPDGACAATIGAVATDWMFRLEHWAKRLGVEPDVYQRPRQSKKPQELLAILHEALGDRRALLIFEDVRTREEAAWLSNVGYNCQRLLTTRYTYVALEISPSSEVIQLEPLDSEQAYALIALKAPQATTAMAEEVRRLVTEIDGLPLAIEIVGRHLDEQFLLGGVPAARLFLSRVQSARDVLGLEEVSSEDRSLKAVLDVTTRDLTPQEIRALSYLAIFPPRANNFSHEAAVTVSGNQGFVDRLRSTGLLELSRPDLGRYAVHRVTAEYARRVAESDPQAEVERAYRRMAGFFIDYVTAPPGDPRDRELWLRDLEYEGQNLREALRWAVRANETLVALQLMSKLWPFWYHRSLFRRAREVAGELLSMPTPEHATRQYFVLRSQLLNDDGNFAYNMAELSDAHARHLEALEIRERLEDDGLQSGSWNNLSLIDRERGDYDTAERRLQDAIAVNQGPQGRLPWLAMNQNNLGLVAECRGHFSEAFRLHEESIKIFEDAGDRWGVAMAAADRGFALLYSGETKEGERILKETLRDRWQVRDRKGVAAGMRGLALAAFLDNEVPLARERLDAAFSLSSGVTDRLGQERALEILVRIVDALQDWPAVARALAGLDTYTELTGAQIPPHRHDPIACARIRMVERLGNDSSEYRQARQGCHSREDYLDLKSAYGRPSPWVTVETMVTQAVGSAAPRKSE